MQIKNASLSSDHHWNQRSWLVLLQAHEGSLKLWPEGPQTLEVSLHLAKVLKILKVLELQRALLRTLGCFASAALSGLSAPMSYACRCSARKVSCTCSSRCKVSLLSSASLPLPGILPAA